MQSPTIDEFHLNSSFIQNQNIRGDLLLRFGALPGHDYWLKISVHRHASGLYLAAFKKLNFRAAQELCMVTNHCTCGASKKILLSAAEVAEMLNIGYHTLLTWRSQGKSTPTAVVMGGVLRYREKDVLEWISEHLEIGGLQ